MHRIYFYFNQERLLKEEIEETEKKDQKEGSNELLHLMTSVSNVIEEATGKRNKKKMQIEFVHFCLLKIGIGLLSVQRKEEGEVLIEIEGRSKIDVKVDASSVRAEVT